MCLLIPIYNSKDGERLSQGHVILHSIIHLEQQVTIYYVRRYAGLENKLHFKLVNISRESWMFNTKPSQLSSRMALSFAVQV